MPVPEPTSAMRDGLANPPPFQQVKQGIRITGTSLNVRSGLACKSVSVFHQLSGKELMIPLPFFPAPAPFSGNRKLQQPTGRRKSRRFGNPLLLSFLWRRPGPLSSPPPPPSSSTAGGRRGAPMPTPGFTTLSQAFSIRISPVAPAVSPPSGDTACLPGFHLSDCAAHVRILQTCFRRSPAPHS